jgi:ATP-dependent Clp protease, protease subunit
MESKRAQKKYQESLSRIITLGEIEDENVNEVISLIYEINKQDEKKSIETREPIQLFLNSPGGHVYYGFGLVDCIEASQTPIHITVQGQAQSMALPILCVGHVRKMSKRSTLMYHEISWETGQEKLRYHKQEAAEGERMQQLYDNVILEYTGVTKKTLKSIKDRNQEWYITPDEALELGFIDEII